MRGHPRSTAARAALARSSSAASSKARRRIAGRSAWKHGKRAFSPARARKNRGTRGTRILRVMSSYASIVCLSACVSSTRRSRSLGFPFSVRTDMLSPGPAIPDLHTRSGTACRHSFLEPPAATTSSLHVHETCAHGVPTVQPGPLTLQPARRPPALTTSCERGTVPRPMVTFDDIVAARERIGLHVERTPCPRSWNFSALCGADIYFKLENLQRTGSFKERGAANKLMLLPLEERRRGVVASSAGNHAQGVAVNARRLGIKAVIVMPESTPLVKIQATRELGAEVVLCGTTFEDAYLEARRLEKEKGYVFVHAFDDEQIIAGQGTAGLEILEQVPDMTVLVAAIGGGGFLGGMALAVKTVKPSVRVIGVEAKVLAKMQAARAAGRPVELPSATTLADGIALKRAGERTLPLFERYVDHLVSVDDEEVANAILLLIEREKTIAEGAGATPAAALLQRRVPDLKADDKVVCCISGGNIDVNLLSRIIERGLVKEGRRVVLRLRVPDRPGALAGVLATVAAEKANVLEVHHERAFMKGPIGDTEIELTVDTRGASHSEQLLAALKAKGYTVDRRAS